MRFTKPLLLVIMSLILAACAGAARKDTSGDVAGQDATENAGSDVLATDGSEPVSEPFVAIPKPASTSVSVPQSARDEFAQARQSMAQKRWSEAAERLLVMTETYPKLAGVYVNLGIAYTELEKLEDAESAYRFAIEKNPLNFDAYTNLGVLLRTQGKFDDAERVYLSALDKWPHHQPSLINLGVLYDLYMGKLPEALSQFELAQKLNVEEDRKLKGWIVDLKRRLPK